MSLGQPQNQVFVGRGNPVLGQFFTGQKQRPPVGLMFQPNRNLHT